MPHDWYGEPLLITPVDALDTFLLLDMKEEAAQCKALILERLSFDLDVSVQVFEVNIRLLGGLLSAFQIDKDVAILDFAKDLAQRLLPAFDSPTGMPCRFVNLKTGKASQPASNPAEIGTLTLELGSLGYLERTKRAVAALFERRSPLGLVGSRIDVETGQWLDARSHIGGGIDSFHEYLWKAWRLFGDAEFKRMWEDSIAAVHRHVADGAWYGVVDMNTGERLATRFGALQAFFPGLLALAGDLPRAERLMASVERMGLLMPEAIDYSDMSLVRPAYELRPEAIESSWHLYRATGDERYRTLGLAMFDAIERATRVEAGYAALADVRTGEKADRMPSFLLAETFKYAGLLALPALPQSMENTVMSTEAHPLRVHP